MYTEAIIWLIIGFVSYGLATWVEKKGDTK